MQDQSLATRDWSIAVKCPHHSPRSIRLLSSSIALLVFRGVPALRVLEDRDSSEGKKIKRAVKGGVMVKDLPSPTGPKANVLGKAVEYIKVLKNRLRAEQTGLKELAAGLERDELDAGGLDNNEAEYDEDGEIGRKCKRGRVASSAATNVNGAAKKADAKDMKAQQSTLQQQHPAGENAAGSVDDLGKSPFLFRLSRQHGVVLATPSCRPRRS
ncbi:hypothetical protein M378DRAFT_17589 [Amanita muscaria Koide BX008]|uniref:BHLH domain-containing protein n=1 Tax=Amanita muscaria (strain Koide BX008) TaxID=946122 RepID=A0A0C2RZL7_AMAMK|nr:hypothetical protein M378DRAFT_17589 [Amanita muscaria Koide BX008]